MRLGQPNKIAAVCPRCGLFASTREEQLRKCRPCGRTDGRYALLGRQGRRQLRGVVG